MVGRIMVSGPGMRTLRSLAVCALLAGAGPALAQAGGATIGEKAANGSTGPAAMGTGSGTTPGAGSGSPVTGSSGASSGTEKAVGAKPGGVTESGGDQPSGPGQGDSAPARP